MIKIENISVSGFEGALRGMRNPLNSWHLADSIFTEEGSLKEIGPKDLGLCLRLIKAGASHRKFLRMIHVQLDVTAPYIGGKITTPIKYLRLLIVAVQCIKFMQRNLF